LLCGYPPFNEDLDIELKDQMARGMYSFPPEPWSSISAEGLCDLIYYGECFTCFMVFVAFFFFFFFLAAKDLVTRMLTPRSDMRIQTNAIATHPWMVPSCVINLLIICWLHVFGMLVFCPQSVKSVQLPSTLTKATLALALSPTAPEQSVPAKRIRLNAAVDASAAPSTSAPAAPVFASPRPPNQQHAERRAQEQQSPAIVGVQSVGKRKAEAQPDSSSQ
jgi:serine/threonine protein kinase